MKKFLLCMLLSAALPGFVSAQTPTKSQARPEAAKTKEPKTEAVAKVETGAPAAPAPPQKKTEAKGASEAGEDKEDPLAKVFGEGAWSLQADRLTSDRDPESGELKTMHVEGSIRIKSEVMNLVCEDLMIDMVKQQMLARGKVVEFDRGDISATCGRLRYDIEEKKTYLEGPPRPIVHQKDPNTGRMTHTNAEKITIIQSGKADSVILEGRVDIQGEAAPSNSKPSNGDKKPPQKIENKSADRIPNPAIDG